MATLPEPYLRTELGELYAGDAWEILPRLPARSYHLVILDPPYVEIRDDRPIGEIPPLRWGRFFASLSRLLAPSGLVLMFCFSSFLLTAAEHIRRHFRVVFDMVWEEPAPVNFLKATRQPLNRHEWIVALLRDGDRASFTYNFREVGTIGEPYTSSRGGYSRFGQCEKRAGSYGPFRYPTTILRYPNKPLMSEDERTDHPTQKPLALISWLIRAFTNRGDRVLDPFLGSGTTAVACEILGRRWTAIELDAA